MKRILTILTIAVAVTLTAAAKGRQLLILHTNATPSCVLPLNPNLADTMLAGRGGFLRRAAMIDQMRKEDKDLLLLDSGDFSQGSPYYTMFKGDVETELMNIMGYDAATIGNHEFDFGLENMARIFRKAKFPIVCANYDFTGTVVEGLLKPYVMIKRKGVRIGIFGLSPKLDGLVMASTCAGVRYSDPIKTANAVADKLKNEEKCDVVICLSHLGWDEAGLNDMEMMAKTRNIDLVLGGHSHSYFKTLNHVRNLDGKDVPNDQNGKHGIFVGKITLSLEKR